MSFLTLLDDKSYPIMSNLIKTHLQKGFVYLVKTQKFATNSSDI